MFKIKFGIAWMIVVAIVFISFPFIKEIPVDISIKNPLFIMFIFFEVIGLYIIIQGLRIIIKDGKTKKYGIQCYGVVRDILKTGSKEDGKCEYKIVLSILNPETKQLETLEEIIGFDQNKYPVNTYVLCKYYQGDINIEKIISEIDIPDDIKNDLVQYIQAQNNSNLESSDNK